ncbi:MAG: flagellar assembly protein FliW [Eubacteriales bacterium]|nr:flagellar assembly protein FliW [Eubacteriales bacterium]
MKINTRYFGEIEIGEEKIIHFENGLFGFEQYKDYTILFDVDSEEEPFFSWLQCVTERELAFPVVNPLKVQSDYDPVVEDELLTSLGDMGEEDLLVLLLATVPEDVKKTSVNMKAPLVINAGTRQGIQIVAENADYEIKHYLIEE